MPETIQTGEQPRPDEFREPDHDDGLVHDHSWACSERGAPAH